MNDYTGKRLLILGGSDVHCKVVEAAKEMGVYTIVTDYLEDSPAKKIADESLMFSILDVDGIIDWCRNNKVDGVLNFCNDPAQHAHQQICENLGLPMYGTKEQVFALTDKQAFKQMCINNGVDVIPEYTEDDLANGCIEYPVFVKPVDSRGSRGQSICYSSAEVEKALLIAKKESSNGCAIIEKCMTGKPDFSMTYLFIDGEAHLIRTIDRYLGNKENNLDRQCICATAPSKYTSLYLEKTNDNVIKMLKNLGISTSPVFMQGFKDGDTFRFYDPGIRFTGTNSERLLLQATGINLMYYMIEYALDGKINSHTDSLKSAYALNGKCTFQLLITARAGKISAFDGLDVISNHSDVVYVSQKANVGDVIRDSGDVRQRICEIDVLMKNDTDYIKDTISWIQKNLIVLDENGSNMLVSPFDVNLI